MHPSYSGVRSGKRYRVCAGNAPLDPAIAVQVMQDAGLEPLEPYQNNCAAWRCRCTKCGKTVSPSYSGVKNGKRCKFCRGQVVTHDQALATMRAAGLEPLEPYRSANAAWRCRCLRCGRDVSPSRTGILGGKRCRYCGVESAASKRQVEPKAAAAVMRQAGLLPAEPYPGYNDLPWKCKCATCGRIVTPHYANVRLGQGGCRFCSGTGFDFASPALVYLLTHTHYQAHKIGVANCGGSRLKTMAKRGWVMFRTRKFDRGDDAYRVEQAILTWLRVGLGLPPYLSTGEGDGWTETFSADAVSLSIVWRQVIHVTTMLANSAEVRADGAD